VHRTRDEEAEVVAGQRVRGTVPSSTVPRLRRQSAGVYGQSNRRADDESADDSDNTVPSLHRDPLHRAPGNMLAWRQHWNRPARIYNADRNNNNDDDNGKCFMTQRAVLPSLATVKHDS